MFPVHMMHDSMWMKRLDYDDAEAHGQLALNATEPVCQLYEETESEACPSVELTTANCDIYPLEMMQDCVWMNRLDYEEAEVNYQMFLSECVKKSVCVLNVQTQTDPAPSVKQTDDNSVMFPVEMMFDTVWLDRLQYEKDEADCQLFLNKHVSQPVVCELNASSLEKTDSQLVFNEQNAKPLSELGAQTQTEDYCQLFLNKHVTQPVLRKLNSQSKEKTDTHLVLNEHTAKPVCELGAQTQGEASSLVEELMIDSSSENAIDSIQVDDFKVLKAAVINLTKFVSTLSQENMKLKNRITNSEARMDKFARTHTPEPKSSNNKVDTISLKKKVEKLEAHAQSMEAMITQINTANYNSSQAQQFNTLQLDQVKQQLLLVFHRSNQNITEMIKKIETAQQVDKVQFDGAMKSLRNYLQNKDSEHKEDLKKLQLDFEEFVAKKTQGVEELVRKIKKQEEADKEAKTLLQNRIIKIEKALEANNKAGTINKKENITWVESSSSSGNSVSKEKPAYTHISSNSSTTSSVDVFNKDSDMIGYLGKANEYLEYFQKGSGSSGANTPGGKTTAGGTNTSVSGTKPITSWTKATECLPIVTAPGAKYTASSASTTVKSMPTFGMGVYSDDPSKCGIKITDPIVLNWFQWKLPRRKAMATEIVHHSITFLTGNPGYRLQLRAQIDRLHGDIYFSVRLMKGVFDDQLRWPFQVRFVIRMMSKSETDLAYTWTIPKGVSWLKVMTKPMKKKENNFSEWVGPFDISNFLEKKQISLEFMPA